MSAYSLIIAIVNAGFADEVMDAARKAGARGGTVASGRGTVPPEAEKSFDITFHPDKETVFILVESDLKDDILKAIYEKVGLNSYGQGIAFALPVDDVAGLSDLNLNGLQNKENADNNVEKPADEEENK